MCFHINQQRTIYKNGRSSQEYLETTSTVKMASTYSLKCVVNSFNPNLLHIEVRNQQRPQECYFRHLTFQELPIEIQHTFINVSHLYVFLLRKETSYFDEQTSTLRISPKIDSIKVIPIELKAQHRTALTQKVNFLEQANKSLSEKNTGLLARKRQEINQLRRKIGEKETNKRVFERHLNSLQNKVGQAQHSIQKQQQYMYRQTKTPDLLLAAKEQTTANLSEDKISSSPKTAMDKISKLERSKQFWIKEVSQFSNPNRGILKQLINQTVNFQERTSLSLNSISLKSMKFVEVFANLKKINLAQNHIAKIKGLTHLPQLKSLNLSHNCIEEVEGLSRNMKLREVNLSWNKVAVIRGLFHLQRLKILVLNHNKIEKIPKKIARLIRLEQLHLNANSVKDISKRILQLQKLTVCALLMNQCYSATSPLKPLLDKLLAKKVNMVSQQYP